MIRFSATGRRRGFSLLELLIVIGIIAALVGLAAPYYQDYIGQSKNSVMRANLHTLTKALMEYRADKGTYPNEIGKLTPKYITTVPQDPEDGAPASWGYVWEADDKFKLDPKYSY
jgi:prepilin-type N-terminal cleavage/methylation domain-containing protein